MTHETWKNTISLKTDSTHIHAMPVIQNDDSHVFREDKSRVVENKKCQDKYILLNGAIHANLKPCREKKSGKLGKLS